MIKKITLLAFALVAGYCASNAATFKAYVSIPDEDVESGTVPWIFYWGIGEGGTACPDWPGLPLDPDKTTYRGGKTWFVYEFETGNEVEDKSGAKVGKIDGFIINDGGGMQSKDFDVNQVGQGWYVVTDWTDKDNGYEDVTANYYKNRPDVVEIPEYQESWVPANLPAYDGEFAYCVNDTKGDKINVWAWGDDGDLYTGWPGLDLGAPVAKDTQGNDIYLWRNETGKTPAQIIFSNNGNPQTADLEFVNGGYYCISKQKGGKLVTVITGGGGGVEEPLKGDLNGDNSVNTGDISVLYDVILGNATDQEVVGKANVNGDDSTNTGDVSALYDIVLGNK